MNDIELLRRWNDMLTGGRVAVEFNGAWYVLADATARIDVEANVKETTQPGAVERTYESHGYTARITAVGTDLRRVVV